MLPTRYTNLIKVRKKYGRRADEAAAFFLVGDPLADTLIDAFHKKEPRRRAAGRPEVMFQRALAQGLGAVAKPPEALRALMAQVQEVPPWLDWDLLELGCRTHLRCGLVGSIILACSALPLAYRSGAGSKPLVCTRTFLDRALERLSQTNRFVLETCKVGGLRPRAPGWQMTVRIRVLFHAQTRWWLSQLQGSAWHTEDHGVPINQVDMAATRLLFCVSLLQQLRRVGFQFSAAESAGVMHLWRYSGHLLGIVPEFLCATETEGRQLLRLLLDVAGGPDDDSRQLTGQLMGTAMPKLVEVALAGLVPGGPGAATPRGLLPRLWQGLWQRGRRILTAERLPGFCYGLSRGILGRKIAAELHFPDTVWRFTAPTLLLSLVAPLEVCRLLMPGGTDLACQLGQKRMQDLMRLEGFARLPTYEPRDI
jgi:hypothetical protein